MQRYYENWKNTEDAQKILRDMFLGPQGLVLNGNAHNLSGVYMFSYVRDGIELPAYIGEAGLGKVNAPSYVADDIYERVLQHLKRFLGNPKYLSYWTGLEKGKGWKIKVQLLCTEEDLRKRKMLEEKFIAEKKPILQHTCGGRFYRYSSPGYTRNDLCIHPWGAQRRVAFLSRLNEVGMSDG